MVSKFISIDELNIEKDFALGYGHFTTIHPGHIRYLKYLKSLSSRVIIALRGDINETNNMQRFEFNQQERAEALSMIDIADRIILLKGDELPELIKIATPKILVLGKQFENVQDKNIVDTINLLKQKGISTLFHGGDISYSNSELLISSEDKIKSKKKEEFKSACIRQGLTLNGLKNSINSWRNTKLIVLGDTILDRYAACEALGMSAEAPVVVVKELENRDFNGGASIVASHIRQLGAKCKLVSVIGDDENGKYIRNKIASEQIEDGLVIDKSRPTTFKKRYLVDNQKLFRVTRLEQSQINQDVEKKIIKELEIAAETANGIVISDFVYGVITNKILVKVHELARKYNLYLFGDLQCSSQVGSIMKFKEFSLLCPNEKEARIALHEKDLDLETLSLQVIKRTNSNKLLMKLGSDGFIAYEHINGKIISQAFPALCVNPLDVTGAGDSLLAAMSVGISSSQKMMESAAIACCMSSISVNKMGNQPITREEILDCLNEKLNF